MDDPWGSPWAATDSDKGQRAASPTKSDIAPPPRAFLSASSSPRIPAVPEQSPWGGDDDGFGEWATTPEAPPVHSVWAGGWGGSSPNLAATPRDDTLNRTSPIAWPGNIATPKLANGSSLRQPSPDPWASAFSSRRPSNDGASTPRLVVEPASPVDAPVNPLGKDALGIGVGPVWDEPHAVEASLGITAVDPVSVTIALEDVGDVEEQTTPVAVPGSDVRVSVESAPPNRQYQSSTPSNDNTDHEEERQDSPITSIDEEPRPGLRKAPGKVQELVVKFDGIARAASEEPVAASQGRSRSPMSAGKRDDSDDGVDFGDFDDGDETGLVLPLELSPAGEKPEMINASATLSPLPDDAPPAPSPVAKFGPLAFEVDLGLVAKLFPTLPEPVGDSGVDHEVTDHIINDSFTEISERKTWYRISRQGSSRRHNAGDDESYRRVMWPSSTVHYDVIKIVRRWMEEDSIAGRVALGGGISKTQKNMFGWDSSAEPVALDAVFGKKKTHSRASSLQTPAKTSLSLDAIGGPAKRLLQDATHRPPGSAGPAVASFGWSSGSTASAGQPGQTLTATTKHEQPNTTAVFSNAHVSTPHTRTASGPPALPKPTINTAGPVCQISPSQGENIADDVDVDDDDDDEWGEMISSPVTSQPTTTNVAIQRSLAASSSTASGPQNYQAVGLGGPVPNDPWGAAEFSVFESTPAKPASHVHVQASTVIARSVEPSAKGPTPGPKPGVAMANPSGPTTTDGSSTSPSTTEPPKAPIGDPQNLHDEAARRIVVNLPDLSYMLC
ncbi:hypothetical protein C8A00DRAFT_18591 [Chaetomidium leptoderma]|uniref:Glucan 1, 4-alpha-glucosidase n=1 Tax=Chaetomidium leptoderma TaxID=669021 RepID=A0AAN6VE88_9PEZI|nr:hypothetical protein C8A00DRAFT_18591 [Chaetomidium leptoderma]